MIRVCAWVSTGESEEHFPRHVFTTIGQKKNSLALGLWDKIGHKFSDMGTLF